MAPTSAVMNSADSIQPLLSSPCSIPGLALAFQPGFAQQSPAQDSPKTPQGCQDDPTGHKHAGRQKAMDAIARNGRQTEVLTASLLN